MPRTKVSKNSKRNRDAAIREEKIREFDSIVEQSINALDFKIKQDIFEIESEISMMKERIMQRVLSMTIGDLRNLNVSKFSEVQPVANFAQLHITESQTSLQNQSSILRTVKKSNDEGYLTEDSTYSANGASQLNLSHMKGLTNTGRVPGPLSSAKARRPRRSQSASGYPGSALKPKPSANVTSNANNDRMSRSKQRTPMVSRQKAASADRTPVKRNLPTSPTALLRWPKPGEMVISMTGTPVVSQVMPEQYANVNIPIRDGVLSLRPKRLQTLDPEIVHKIDQETLTQIKLLQSNLELIMSYADKGGKL